jgi:branched-chain amino acid transport system substrate-binding protein
MSRIRVLLQAVAFVLTGVIALSTQAAAATQGVTDTEITIGTVTDLSGVTAIQGVNNANAIRLLFDEANEKGGINGRKIHYIVEDSQYQVPRAVQAMNKLLNNDRVFMTLQDGGTPMNNATWPMALEKGVPKLLPLTAARSMFEPFNHLKFSQTSSSSVAGKSSASCTRTRTLAKTCWQVSRCRPRPKI